MNTKTHPGHIGILRFKFLRDTPGALRYVEIDQQGNPITKDEQGAFIGTLYLRKAALKGAQPTALVMDLDNGTLTAE